MKAFINLLIDDSDSTTADEILDTVLATLEQEGLNVIWSKASEAKQ